MADKPITLALSTFRQSDKLVRETIEAARAEGRDLMVLFVVDRNLARYVHAPLLPKEKRETRTEEELLEEFRGMADEKVAEICELATAAGVKCETAVTTGRFGVEVVKAAKEREPEKITLTRSNRPKWVLQLFGSPVDYIIENAGCPVVEINEEKEEEERETEGASRGWMKALFSFSPSAGGVRYGIVGLVTVFFLAVVYAPAPKSLLALMSQKSPVGYQLQSGTSTITESVNKILGTTLTDKEAARKAKVMIAILFSAALLWATEAIPLGATDLLVGALLYLFFILPLDTISKAYMKDAVFFIFGVLAIAVGVAKSGLDRRISLLLLGKVKGLKTFCFIFLPLLAVAAGFLSEHALIAILIPVLLGVYRLICDAYKLKSNRALAVFLLVGICFAANQGGPGSPAAGGRNAVMVGYLKEYGMAISFAEWMMCALPYVVVVSLCVGAYMYFTFKRKIGLEDVNFGEFIRKETGKLQKMTRKETLMAVILSSVVIMWIAGSKRLGLGGPCVFAVVLMLTFNILNWKDIQSKVRFEVVGLYAAACAMGVGLKVTGGSVWLAQSIVNMLPEGMRHGQALLVTTSLFTGVLTNFMSDGATVASIGPVVLSMSQVAGIHAWKLGLACAFSSSFANVLIIGTPNNALVYVAGVDPKSGERLVTLKDFVRYGIPVTIIAWAVLWLWGFMGYWNWIPWPS